MCKQMDQIKIDLARFQETGELPEAWAPSRYVDDEEFDRRVDEINREMEAIDAGCIEPPKFGWLIQIGRRA
jgi:hypothetical protein